MELVRVPDYSPSASHHHGSSGFFLHSQLPNNEGLGIYPVFVGHRWHLLSVYPYQV
uniref:Proannomuricatin L n=1 Tax=Annona muricata TaxID=13337 RepID=A0A5B9T6E8_ANNMU|nr:proannomuricatin L [Annona muricata]